MLAPLPFGLHEFDLGGGGEVSWDIPGLATGTLWRVNINCAFDPPNQFAKPGLFDDTVTY